MGLLCVSERIGGWWWEPLSLISKVDKCDARSTYLRARFGVMWNPIRRRLNAPRFCPFTTNGVNYPKHNGVFIIPPPPPKTTPEFSVPGRNFPASVWGSIERFFVVVFNRRQVVDDLMRDELF